MITPDKPAKPGDFIILWGTGMGPGPSDDRPGAFDKRAGLIKYKFDLGGFKIDSDKIRYIGSGGAIAVDQAIIELPPLQLPPLEYIPDGCHVPIKLKKIGDAKAPEEKRADGQEVTAGMEPDPAATPTVTIPFSRDGSPCGDPHGYTIEAVNQLFETGDLTQFVARVSEIMVIDGDQQQDLVGAEVIGQTVTQSTFNPPNPLGTCRYEWLPPGVAGPNTPQRAELDGSIGFKLPWTEYNLSASSRFGPFLELLTRPDPATMLDGLSEWLAHAPGRFGRCPGRSAARR